MTRLVDLLGLQQTATGALAPLLEYAEILARVALALQVRDARPAALTTAALAAAAGAGAGQDAEDLQEQLAGHVAAARQAMEQLQALADELDAAAGGLAEEAAAHETAAAAKQAKTRKYEEQQRAIAARLKAVGYCPEIGQASLQARGRDHSRMLADLKQTEAELARFRGLPTDDAAARATAAEKRGELERLRRRLQEHVNAMQ
ncbi:hypothetical protein ABPG77_005332 [Micractinium sp. CCAP 211/92]